MGDRKVIAGCCCERDSADAVIFSPLPAEGISAGEAVREASTVMETYSPYQRKDLTDLALHDCGDISISKDLWQAIDTIESFCGHLHDDQIMPVMLASHHLLSLGCIRAAASRWDDLCVIHIGAHAELKRIEAGEDLMSRTLIRRTWDLIGDDRIYELGIRCGSREEFEWGVAPHIRMEKFDIRKIDSFAEAVARRPVYLTLDTSVVDPGEFPGTYFPNAGGIRFSKLHDALMSINNIFVVGFDICGLFPSLDDRTGTSASLVYKLLREMLAAYV